MTAPVIEPMAIADVLLLRPALIADRRGVFQETWNRAALEEAGIATDFVQENQSLSHRAGTVRGLHFQRPPFAQAKLVRVVAGAAFDVAVDLRPGSPTFGRWCAAELTGAGGEQMLVPAGFAHGLCTLADQTIVAYRLTRPYSRAHEAGISWDDPALGIPWPVRADAAILSERDRGLPPLAALDPPFG